MTQRLNNSSQHHEDADFNAFITLHNHRVMKTVLAICLVMDIIYYFLLIANTDSLADPQNLWVIPCAVIIGLLILIWFFRSSESVGIFQEYTFLIFILGSRVAFGDIIGFQFTNLSVYIGLMLVMSALFYFWKPLLHTLIFTQSILLLLTLTDHIGPYSILVFFVTSVFAISSVALSWERYKLRLQTYLLNHSIMNKNQELQGAYEQISTLYNESKDQLNRIARAENILGVILDSSDSAMALIDRNHGIRYSNDGLYGIAGYRFENMDKMDIQRILGENQFNTVLSGIRNTFLSGEPTIISPLFFNNCEGVPCVVKARMDYIDIAGEGHILINLTDITKETAQQQQIQQAAAIKDVVLSINHHLYEEVDFIDFLEYALSRVREVIPHADLGCILLMEEDGSLRIVSSFGYNQSETPSFLLPLSESFAYRVTGGNFVKTIIINDIPSLLHNDCVGILENERGYDVLSSLSGPIIINNQLYGLINIDSKDNNVYTENDVAIMEYLREQLGLAISRRNLYQQYSYLSKHDQMTGFMNRWYLREIEGDQLPRWERYKVQFTVATMDLNHLKQVNDKLGHHEGDAYIYLFSSTVKTLFRSTDILIRLGGDEFAGVFFNISEEELAAKLDEANNAIENSPLQQIIPVVHLSFAYGIIQPKEPGIQLEDLLKQADAKMYLHKAEMKRKHGSNSTDI